MHRLGYRSDGRISVGDIPGIDLGIVVAIGQRKADYFYRISQRTRLPGSIQHCNLNFVCTDNQPFADIKIVISLCNCLRRYLLRVDRVCGRPVAGFRLIILINGCKVIADPERCTDYGRQQGISKRPYFHNDSSRTASAAGSRTDRDGIADRDAVNGQV